MEPIEVVEYDPRWPGKFAELARHVRAAFEGGSLIAIEHVGSTSVAGLAAKPIIDIDVIIPSSADVSEAITRLETLGYVYQVDLGILGRQAFQSPPATYPHHLYLCPWDNVEYRRHVAFRDHLRMNTEEARRYECLKRDLAVRFRDDRKAYANGKTDFVQAILEKARQ